MLVAWERVAVLLQEGEDEAEHPAAFFSKKLSSAQRNYSVIEHELLAILLALVIMLFML